MKGRKFNSEFLSSFITDCIQRNKATTEEILQEAKKKISEIDEKIIEVEKLKRVRADYLDVVSTFEKPIHDKEEQKQALQLFNIANPVVCKFICNIIKEKPEKISGFMGNRYDAKEIMFCLKQLLEHRVISRQGDFVLRGYNFAKYMSYVFKEAE
jgi:hypothetical protein